MNDKIVKDTNSTRLGGTDRYDTNKKIINKFYSGVKEFDMLLLVLPLLKIMLLC